MVGRLQGPRQVERRALQRGRVQRRQLLHQQVHRQAVDDDVVRLQQQPVFARRQLQQVGLEQRAAGEVEGLVGMGGEFCVQRRGEIGRARQVGERQHAGAGELFERQHALPFAIDNRAQRVVAAHQLAHGSPQRR